MRRDRSTIFRLTEAEYAQLEAACRASGARSVSDYIRGAVLAQMAGGTLTERVEALESAVKVLSGRSGMKEFSAAYNAYDPRKSAEGD